MQTRGWVALALCLAVGVAAAHAGEVPGYSRPYQEVEVASSETGVLALVRIADGERVEKGQVLARLDSAVLEAQLAVAQARARSQGKVESCRAELAFNEARLTQLAKLHQSEHARSSEVERARTDVEVFRAKLKDALEQQEVTRLEALAIQAQLASREIRSPFRGVVRKVLRRAGERLSASEPGVVKLAELDRLLVAFHVPLSSLAGLQVGQAVTVRFEHPAGDQQGTIAFIDPVADSASATVKVDVLVPNPEWKLRGGVRCYLRVGSPTARKPPG